MHWTGCVGLERRQILFHPRNVLQCFTNRRKISKWLFYRKKVIKINLNLAGKNNIHITGIWGQFGGHVNGEHV